MSLRRIAAATLAVAAFATVPAIAATSTKTTTTKTTTTTTTAAGPAAAGKKVYDAQCGICHSVDPAKPGAVGPHLNGVVDRKVGADASFTYSKAMKAKSHKWTKGNLDIYLTDPQKFVPGTTMPVSVPAAADRAAVIAYLATTK
jgi:cytochrome c2